MPNLFEKIDIFVSIASKALQAARKKALILNASWLDETDEERLQKETAEKEKEDGRKRRNAEVWAKIESWFNQFGDSELEYEHKEMEEYNPEYASNSVKKMTSLHQLGDGAIFTVTAKVDRNTGDCVIDNVRVVHKGRHISESIKQLVLATTGKQIEYHKPTDAWAYDAQINGRLKPGDGKMLAIAKAFGNR